MSTPVTTLNDQMQAFYGGGAVNDALHSYIANSANVSGTASPEAAQTADPGNLFRDTTNAHLYIKATGNGNTGWAKFARVVVASIPTFTQTYSTTTTTVPNATAAAVATDAAALTSYGFTETQANAIVTNLNALVADSLANRKLINAVIDALQLAGIAL